MALTDKEEEGGGGVRPREADPLGASLLLLSTSAAWQCYLSFLFSLLTCAHSVLLSSSISSRLSLYPSISSSLKCVRIGVSPGTSAINLPRLRWYGCNNTCESLGERDMEVWADLYFFPQLNRTDKSKLNFHQEEYKACAVQKQHGGWRWRGGWGRRRCLSSVVTPPWCIAAVHLIDAIWRCGFCIELD